MRSPASLTTPAAAQHVGQKYPSSIEQPGPGSLCQATILNRVGRVLQDMTAERAVSDGEIRQHAVDCSRLMEQAYERFQDSGNPADRDEALLWMYRRDEAVRALSTAWQAAREAQIQQDISQGAGYFIDQGERDRISLGGAKQ